jgi:hypothetical protein
MLKGSIMKNAVPSFADPDPTLDDLLRIAVKKVMSSESAQPNAVAKVQELLDRKAAQIRAPSMEKLRRARLSA